MTQEEIIKGNKAIDVFMGVSRIPSFGKNNNDFSYVQAIQYHSSWDWIMPVCQKINSKESFKGCERNGIKNSAICYIEKMRKMKDGAIRFDLERTYAGVVEFIQWYNEQEGEK